MEAKILAERLGRAIKKIRLKKELSRNELSEQSGVSPVTIQRTENGQAIGLGLDNLLALTKILDISVSDLLHTAEYVDVDVKKNRSQLDEINCNFNKLTSNQKDLIAGLLREIVGNYLN